MTRTRLVVTALVAVWISVGLPMPALSADDAVPAYKDPKAPLEARVVDLVQRMTVDEKLLLVGGTGFGTQPIERLGLPAMGGPIGLLG